MKIVAVVFQRNPRLYIWSELGRYYICELSYNDSSARLWQPPANIFGKVSGVNQ